MGSCMDRILEILREHPAGLTVPDISALYYPSVTGYEVKVRGGSLSKRLNKLERQGLTRRAGTVRVERGHRIIWQAVE